MDITKLTEQFQSIEELKAFAGSQFKQILQLTKKIKELEEKAIEAKKESRELVKKDNTSLILPNSGIKGQEDAKVIAGIQLQMLKQSSFERELTLEEAKKVELFNKILLDPNKNENPLKADITILKESDLLKLINE
jgi:hypothetical protein